MSNQGEPKFTIEAIMDANTEIACEAARTEELITCLDLVVDDYFALDLQEHYALRGLTHSLRCQIKRVIDLLENTELSLKEIRNEGRGLVQVPIVSEKAFAKT